MIVNSRQRLAIAAAVSAAADSSWATCSHRSASILSCRAYCGMSNGEAGASGFSNGLVARHASAAVLRGSGNRLNRKSAVRWSPLLTAVSQCTTRLTCTAALCSARLLSFPTLTTAIVDPDLCLFCSPVQSDDLIGAVSCGDRGRSDHDRRQQVHPL